MDIREIGVLGMALLLGGLLAAGITHLRSAEGGNIPSPDCPKIHKFINPELDCINADELFREISKTQSVLEDQIAEFKKTDDVERVSLFYRDLNTRRWFGINPDKPFAPGSLLKLPLAIAYFKLAEIEPGVLTQQYSFNGFEKSLNDMEHFKPAKNLVSGQTYSTIELIEQMIEYSDNDVVPILSNGINANFFEKVYLDLGVHFPTSGGIEQNFVSVRTYAGILRTLYVSSYLNTEHSETMLGIMTKGNFDSGVKAGLPREILYASKFGERTITSVGGGGGNTSTP